MVTFHLYHRVCCLNYPLGKKHAKRNHLFGDPPSCEADLDGNPDRRPQCRNERVCGSRLSYSREKKEAESACGSIDSSHTLHWRLHGDIAGPVNLEGRKTPVQFCGDGP
jgi:hypothetical protein